MPAAPDGHLLTAPDGVTYRFDPGALCMELLLTGGEGWLEMFERLHRPEDLARWLPETGLAALAPVDPKQVRLTTRDLGRAKRLREAIRRSATSIAHGASPSPADLALLNYLAAPPPLVPQIDERTGARRTWVGPITGAQVLSSFARDAIDLFTGPQRSRVRECAADDCRLLFVDTSRPGARRWCSMQRCGNRSKVRTFRQRSERTPVSGGRATRRGSR
jgi:predicted RNA-binding Zn ribbon-like protein